MAKLVLQKQDAQFFEDFSFKIVKSTMSFGYIVMYICICNAVTDTQIRHAVKSGQCSSMRQLCQEYRIATQCGKCCQDAKKIFKECQSKSK